MLISFIKTAWRGLWKQKGFSFLNIAGLAVGIASASLIFLWVEDEVTFNGHFTRGEQIYQVYGNQTYGQDIYTFAALPGPLTPAIKEEIPGVVRAARTTWGNRALLTKGDQSIYAHGLNVDPDFLEIFDYEFVTGDSKTAFEQLHTLVITESLAKKLYNEINVSGQTIKVDNQQDYVISGVVKDPPQNSQFAQVEWLAPFEVFYKQNISWLNTWNNFGVQGYIELDKAADAEITASKLHTFLKTKDTATVANAIMLGLADWRLRSQFEQGHPSGGRIKIVKLLSLVAWIILILACINFMNLTTARSERRMREVGVRKVLGSARIMLLSQFFIEAMVMTFSAIIIALIIIAMALPQFNGLVQKNLSISILNPVHLIFLIAIWLLCGTLSASYPAFYLSGFKPITVLKSIHLSTGGAPFVRKVLVVSQFVISIIFISATVIIHRQIQYTKSRDLGIVKDHLIAVDQNLITTDKTQNVALRFNSVRNDLLNSGLVEEATLCNSQAFQIGSNSASFNWSGKDPSKEILISMEWVTPSYLKTMGMQLVAGRDFYPDGLVDSLNIIINESFAKQVATDAAGAVGKLIDRGDYQLTVVGVTKDYLFEDIYGSAPPLVIFCDPQANNTSNVMIRFKPGLDYAQALKQTGEIFKKYNPVYPFEYEFVDERFARLFASVVLINKLSGLFSGLAIFISCLGLFGLAAYTAERRTREIGVRKVLGASVQQVSALLSAEFLKLVFISGLVAVPITWYIMQKWLEKYSYRIEINVWMLLLPTVTAFVIALLTVSFQSIRAALVNPVNSLKHE